MLSQHIGGDEHQLITELRRRNQLENDHCGRDHPEDFTKEAIQQRHKNAKDKEELYQLNKWFGLKIFIS